MTIRELESQIDQSWKMYDALVEGFDDHEWINAGCGHVTPARVALHVLLGVEYYSNHKSDLRTRFGKGWPTVASSELPSRAEVLRHSRTVKDAFHAWLTALDLDQENTQFPWAGKTQLGVLIFVLRHTMYHIGELNALLYDVRKGEIGDQWMAGFRD